MTRKLIPLLVAALFVSACMTAAQKKDKSNAETTVASAGAALAAARLGGGEDYSATRMRSAESDFRMAQEKLKVGDWSEASRRARLAASVADDIRVEAEAARKRAAANKPAPFKAGPVKKKARTVPK